MLPFYNNVSGIVKSTLKLQSVTYFLEYKLVFVLFCHTGAFFNVAVSTTVYYLHYQGLSLHFFKQKVTFQKY
jgi:hypothetical protein